MNDASAVRPLIMKGLNAPWAKVAHLGLARSFHARAIIPAKHSNTPGAGIFFIKKGKVCLSNIFKDGQECILLFFGEGMLFNETPVFTDTSHCVFTSLESTDVIFWAAEHLRDILSKEPDLAVNLISSLGTKMSYFYSQLCDVRTYDVFKNVCRILYSMVVHNTVKGKIVPYLTQIDMAALLGAHRSTLHKALFRLKEEGVVGEYGKKSLTVLDVDRLRHYAFG